VRQTWAIERILATAVTDREATFSCIAGGGGGAVVTLPPWASNVVRCRFTAGTIPAAPAPSYVTGNPDAAARFETFLLDPHHHWCSHAWPTRPAWRGGPTAGRPWPLCSWLRRARRIEITGCRFDG